MSRFRQKAVISEVEGTDLWMLERDLIYESDLLRAEYAEFGEAAALVVVPAGFIYDGSSIPDVLRALPIISFFVAPKIKYPGAAALHDYGYRYALWPRDVTDKLYREALEVEGAGKVRRFVRYLGVRIGGWRAYNGKEQDDDSAK